MEQNSKREPDDEVVDGKAVSKPNLFEEIEENTRKNNIVEYDL